MRVLVTGATGLVGCHAVAALLRRGHGVRALVRSPERLTRALRPLDAVGVEVAEGDVTRRSSIEAALPGCDALVHAAGVFSFDLRRAPELLRTNVHGTRNALGAAVAAGLDPVIHVSSLSALAPFDGPLLTAREGVKRPTEMYARSKALAERVARRLQESGAPVVTLYPGSVWGPCDPTVGEGIDTVLDFVRFGLVPITPGGIPLVDARDLADAIAALVGPGLGPRRYLAGGALVTPGELAAILGRLTGRRFRTPRLSGRLVRSVGRLGDVAQRWLRVRSPVCSEMVNALTGAVPCDNSDLEKDLGVTLRPPEQTLGDVLRWAHGEGILSATQVGRIASGRDPGWGAGAPA